jgi:purine-binding chemotaxis protein CheW
MTPLEPAFAEDRGVQLCAFCVGDEEYVVDIRRIEEILQPQKVTPVSRAPGFVEGVVNLRGLVLPVIALRQRLGSGPARKGSRPKLLVCRIGRRRVGLAVDAVTEVVWARHSELKPLSEATHSEMPAVIGIWGPAERPRLLLNLKAVLREEPPVDGRWRPVQAGGA